MPGSRTQHSGDVQLSDLLQKTGWEENALDAAGLLLDITLRLANACCYCYFGQCGLCIARIT